jgi:hypothetical protein
MNILPYIYQFHVTDEMIIIFLGYFLGELRNL